MTTPSITVTYLFDPLCGWCYAAAPALNYLQGVEGIEVALAPTGLFAGAGARPMDAQFAAYAWANDQRIQQLTGSLSRGPTATTSSVLPTGVLIPALPRWL